MHIEAADHLSDGDAEHRHGREHGRVLRGTQRKEDHEKQERAAFLIQLSDVGRIVVLAALQIPLQQTAERDDRKQWEDRAQYRDQTA